MTNAVSLHNDNAGNYLKDFFTHLSEEKASSQDFSPSMKSRLMSSMGSNKRIYEDLKKFYSSKKSSLIFLKDKDTHQYQGHAVLKFNKIEEDDISKYVKTSKFSAKDELGIDEKDGEGYLSLSKMSVRKEAAKEKNVFQKCYMGVFEKLGSLKVPQIVINSKNNETFKMLCKFCNGVMLDAKNSINYIIPVNVEKIKEAFKEMELINIVRNKEGIGAIIGGIKQTLAQKQKEKEESVKNTSVSNVVEISKQTHQQQSSATARLKWFKEQSSSFLRK